MSGEPQLGASVKDIDDIWIQPSVGSHILNAAARVAAYCVFLVGVSILLGWTYNIGLLKSFHPGWPPVAPLTVLAFLLVSLSLWCVASVGPVASVGYGKRWRLHVSQICAAIVAMIGLLKLGSYLFGWNLQIDTLFFRDVPGPGESPAAMAHATALAFLLMGGALFVASRPRGFQMLQVLALLCILIGWVGFSRYLYGGSPLVPYSQMSAITAFCFLVLSGGVLCVRTDGGLTALFLSESAGGLLFRRLLPPALVMPFLLGWVQLKAQRAEWFDAEGGLVLFALSNVLLFTALIWTSAVVLNRADLKRGQTARRLEESLKEIGDLKTALDEHAIVAITDPQGKITYVNDKFCAISKYSRGELLGQDHRIINSGFHSKEFIHELWTTIRRGNVWKGEIKNRAKDGSFYWVDTTIVPFLSDDGKPRQYVAIRADITERKEAEEKVQQLNSRLEQRVAERTAELEAFSYSISHDLRAPLRAMGGFARMIQEDFGAQFPPEASRQLERIHANAMKMGLLIDGLLEFSRLSRQPLNKSKVSPTTVVKRVLEELQSEMEGRNVRVVTGNLPACQADATLLHQVFMNLLSNALKYSRQRDPAIIEIGAREEDGRCVYVVKDNGAGFEMDYAHNLFGVFQRLHRADQFEGTGVGLAIVRRIVHRHGGRVWAEAESEKGATFFFTLEGELLHG